LSSADLVFEHFAEGGITRFTAVFYGKMPERVGSVRSGRLIDLEIPAMYQAVFSFSGASSGVKDQMRASDLFPNQIVAPDFGVGEPYFYRVPREGVAFEHTLFADPESLHALAAERGVDKRPDFPSLMASRGPASRRGMTDITYFEVNYLTGTCTAEWRYDSTKGAWLRSTVGQPHTDYLTGEQLAFPNVIVLYANHVETDIWRIPGVAAICRFRSRSGDPIRLWSSGMGRCCKDTGNGKRAMTCSPSGMARAIRCLSSRAAPGSRWSHWIHNPSSSIKDS
jgi:hypothetical protein